MGTLQFLYTVTTRLWKSPFIKGNDEIEGYLKAKRENAYSDSRTFYDEDNLLVARQQSMNYCSSMIEVLCESVGTEYRDYWQALVTLQPLLRADHELAHMRTGLMEFDDDMFMGISITFRVQNGDKSDEMEIFSLPCYCEDHREEIYEAIVYNVIALERESFYIQCSGINLNGAHTVDFTRIGLTKILLLPTLFDMNGFLAFYGDFKVDEWLDMNLLNEYRNNPFLNSANGKCTRTKGCELVKEDNVKVFYGTHEGETCRIIIIDRQSFIANHSVYRKHLEEQASMYILIEDFKPNVKSYVGYSNNLFERLTVHNNKPMFNWKYALLVQTINGDRIYVDEAMRLEYLVLKSSKNLVNKKGSDNSYYRTETVIRTDKMFEDIKKITNKLGIGIF